MTKQLEIPTCNDKPIWDVWMSLFHFPTLVAADEMGLFDLLHNNSLTKDEIATTLLLSNRACEALLSVLTSLNFLQYSIGQYHLTDVSKNFLVTNSPFYSGGLLHPYRNAVVNGNKIKETLKNDTPHNYANGKTAINLMEKWEQGTITETEAEMICKSMHSMSLPAALGVARWGNFKDVNHLLDVAGGSGCYSIALAQQYPAMKFTVMELPAVCTITKKYIDNYGLSNQINTFAANFFTNTWFSGCDAVFLSNILHDWNTEQCLFLLRKSYENLPEKGKIYIHELLMNDLNNGSLVAASYSMTMMLRTLGKQFSALELKEMLEKTGFINIEIIPTYGYYSLIIANK